MVNRVGLLALVWAAAFGAFGEAATQDGPTLYGDGGGRVWSWSGGEKTWLTSEGLNLVLGGVEGDSLWGWSQEGGQSRVFTLPLPPKKAPSTEAPEPVFPTFGSWVFPTPDRAEKSGDLLLLVWTPQEGPARFEVWRGRELLSARAWEARSVYALALGPGGWILGGRTDEGRPWLEVNGAEVPPPGGWRGRLTVTAWVEASPRAAGWGAGGTEPARPLLWSPDGWVVPVPGEEPLPGTYPVLGGPGESGELVLAGWQSDDSGALRPWFWDGQEASVPGGTADGQPVAFSAGGQGGAFLIVRHQTAPWFTREDGEKSEPLVGLDADDHVVVVATSPAKR